MLPFLGLHGSPVLQFARLKLQLTTLLKRSRLEKRLLRYAFYLVMYSRQKLRMSH